MLLGKNLNLLWSLLVSEMSEVCTSIAIFRSASSPRNCSKWHHFLETWKIEAKKNQPRCGRSACSRQKKLWGRKKYMFAVEKSCSPITLGNWSGLVAAGPQPSAMIGFTNSPWWFLNTTQSLLVIRSMFLALWSTWQKPRGDGRKKGNLSSEPEWIHPTWSAAHCTSFDFEKPERHFPREREVSTSNQMFLSGLLAVWKNLVITGPLEKFAGYLVENEGVLAEDREDFQTRLTSMDNLLGQTWPCYKLA